MKTSVIVPCYNESATISNVIEKLKSISTTDHPIEIIIVDDCSTDGTKKILEDIPPQENVRICFHANNTGKGGAIKTGAQLVTGDVVIIQDADLEYNPAEIPNVVTPIIHNTADICYGSRFLNKNNTYGNKPFPLHKIVNNLLTYFFTILSGLPTTDMHTCFKAHSREVFDLLLPQMQSDNFNFDTELAARDAKLVKKGFRFYETPITYTPRSYNEGKKITWKDGLRSVIATVQFTIFTK